MITETYIWTGDAKYLMGITETYICTGDSNIYGNQTYQFFYFIPSRVGGCKISYGFQQFVHI